MSDSFDPTPAATLLADAWRAGTLMTALPEQVRPANVSQGYDVQDRFISMLGEQVVGWKLGVGSTLQKRQSGVGRSIAGRVLHSMLFEEGDVVPLPSTAPVTIEFEIAYVLGRDIAPYEPAFPIAEAISEVRVSFELVLARFVDRRAVGWPSFAADNAAFHALVLGDPIDPGQLDELRSSLQVVIDDKVVATSLGGEDMTDPMAALQDLVAIARERGVTLPRRSIVSTGTVSKPVNSAGERAVISARFLGKTLQFRTLVRSPAS